MMTPEKLLSNINIRADIAAKRLLSKIKRSANIDDSKIGIICPAGIGDTFIICSLIKGFIIEHSKTPVLIIKKSHFDVVEMFENGEIERTIIDDEDMKVLGLYFCYNKTSESSFIYGHFFGCPYKEDLKAHNILASEVINLYKTCVLEISNEALFNKPDNIAKINVDYYISEYKIVPGKTFILFPEANSTRELSVDFWNLIADFLKAADYKVIFNITRNGDFYKGDKFNIPLSDIIGVANICGNVIALRSGACDVLSLCQANFWVLYNNIFFYNNCSLKKMGLADEITELNIEDVKIRNSLYMREKNSISYRIKAILIRIHFVRYVLFNFRTYRLLKSTDERNANDDKESD